MKKLDVKKSGTYLIDPDGPDHGDPPFEAECDMKTGERKKSEENCMNNMSNLG